jgi:superfamily II DNA or RNA helicase
LSNYQVVVMGVPDDEDFLQGLDADADVKVGEQALPVRTAAGLLGLARATSRYDLRRVLTFHSRVHLAEAPSEVLPFVSARAGEGDADTVWTHAVSGAIPSSQRAALLREFDRQPVGVGAVVSNVRCLGEGVDVPSIDAVAFIDPTRSPVEIVQAVGRAIRKAADK